MQTLALNLQRRPMHDRCRFGLHRGRPVHENCPVEQNRKAKGWRRYSRGRANKGNMGIKSSSVAFNNSTMKIQNTMRGHDRSQVETALQGKVAVRPEKIMIFSRQTLLFWGYPCLEHPSLLEYCKHSQGMESAREARVGALYKGPYWQQGSVSWTWLDFVTT